MLCFNDICFFLFSYSCSINEGQQMCLSEDSNGWVKGVFEIYLCHASGGENVRIDFCVW